MAFYHLGKINHVQCVVMTPILSESDGNDIDTYNYEIMHCLMTAAKKCSRVTTTTTTTTTILHPFNILFTGNLDKLAPQM